MEEHIGHVEKHRRLTLAGNIPRSTAQMDSLLDSMICQAVTCEAVRPVAISYKM